MTIHLYQDKGVPLERQRMNWKEMVGHPISKLDDDAFTRVRAILMNGVEGDSLRTKQVALRTNSEGRQRLAQLMRVEQHQSTTISALLSADHSPLETAIAHDQTAVEVTASVAQLEPDAYLAQGYRFALLEDFDHLYRCSALLDRLEGKDANNITQGYTDIVPGRETWSQHRAPAHDLLEPYGADAALSTKLHALTLTGAAFQTHLYCISAGAALSDPLARQLFAEFASVKGQHIVHYGSMLNPKESALEKLLLAEACEVWNYAGCAAQETNPAVRSLWERFLEYELGHLQVALELFQEVERRDPAEVLGDGSLPAFIRFKSQRDFIREVVESETALRKRDTAYVGIDEEGESSLLYRAAVSHGGSPSRAVSSAYSWISGTELVREAARALRQHEP